MFFAATGITDGSLLRGVKYWPDGATTFSMVMRNRSGTVRLIEAEHRFEKLERFSRIALPPLGIGVRPLRSRAARRPHRPGERPSS